MAFAQTSFLPERKSNYKKRPSAPLIFNLLRLLVALAAVCLWCSLARSQSAYALEGDGSQDAPYRITTADELVVFAEAVNAGQTNAHAVLESDVDLNPGTIINLDGSLSGSNPAPWTPIADPGSPFGGVFDGQGHEIRGVYIEGSEDDQGLFGALERGTVKNLGVANSYIKGNVRVGAVCGNNGFTSTIENCYSSGVVVGSEYVGGVCGYNSNAGEILNCYHAGAAIGNKWVGGVCGGNNGIDIYPTIKNCYNTGYVTGTGPYDTLGGVCGRNEFKGLISSCYNRGTVKGSGSANAVGGICALVSDAYIEDCYNAGAVSGGSPADNIFGIASRSSVTNCYYLAPSGTPPGESGDNTPKSKEQFASGEVAWLLDHKSRWFDASNPVWGQALSGTADAMPTFIGQDKANAVYRVSYEVSADAQSLGVTPSATQYVNLGCDVAVASSVAGAVWMVGESIASGKVAIDPAAPADIVLKAAPEPIELVADRPDPAGYLSFAGSSSPEIVLGDYVKSSPLGGVAYEFDPAVPSSMLSIAGGKLTFTPDSVESISLHVTVKPTWGDNAAKKVASKTFNLGFASIESAGYQGVFDGEAHGIAIEVPDGADLDIRYKDENGNYTLADAPTYTDANASSFAVGYQVGKSGYVSPAGGAWAKRGLQGEEHVAISIAKVTGVDVPTGLAFPSYNQDGRAALAATGPDGTTPVLPPAIPVKVGEKSYPLNVKWDIGAYNAMPGETNNFTWTFVDGEPGDAAKKLSNFDIADSFKTGTASVKNAAVNDSHDEAASGPASFANASKTTLAPTGDAAASVAFALALAALASAATGALLLKRHLRSSGL